MAATDDKVGTSSSSRRKGYGRKKIAMKKIEKNSSLRVTFSKCRCRPGLFKKANELSLLCSADVAVITFSPGGKLFSFGNPSADAIIDRYINSGGLIPGAQVLERPEVVEEETTGGNRQGFWWEVLESELERMELTDLERYEGELEKFTNKLRFRVMMVSGSDSGSNSNQPGTSSTVESANSDVLILQDIEKMMEEASPQCNSFSLDDGFDWSFLFDESPSSVEDDSAARCCFNESISAPAETCSSGAVVEYPECNSFCLDNTSYWNWGFGFDQPTPIPIPIPAGTPMVEYPASVATWF